MVNLNSIISRITKLILQICLTIALSLNLPIHPNRPTIFLPMVSSAGVPSNQEPIRGIWVGPTSLYTKENIDRALERVVAGGFNTIFACVFFEGQTLYRSTLAITHSDVERGLNPLAYLIQEAHRRDIKVHAWFVTGNMGERDESPLLAEHPNWKLIGPDGGSYGWLNFALPEVRQFLSDLAAEVVKRYGVDGVHLDYIRYPDAEWGFDPYSMDTFQREYGIDPNLLRYQDLPAYGMISGNPLTDPSTASVLAFFSNGYPAVTLNHYGEGEVILLNWESTQRNLALNSEILRRSLNRLLQPGGDVFLLRSKTNASKYGYDRLDETKAWLQYLGWDPQEVRENVVSNLSPESVLVLPGIYLITPETASQMADFVRRGGGMILIDGPTPSINLTDIQAITGMQSRGRFFREPVIMTATGENPLIPTSKRQANLSLFQSWEAAWKDFRREGVTLTVQEVQKRVKSISSDVIISTVIPGTPDSSFQKTMQDWPTWLRTKSVDGLVLLLYVDRVRELEPELDAWKQAMSGAAPYTIGLITYTSGNRVKNPKTPEQVMGELGVLREAGITSFSIFSLESLSDDQLNALAKDSQVNNRK